MRVVATMDVDLPLAEVPAFAKRAEALGYDGLSVPEAVHDGMLTALLALEHTTRLRVGTGVVVAFARSPTLVAQDAWSLAQMSGGRFELGLGTQVRGNIIGRFGMPWSAPAPRIRDYVHAVRAVFDCWQNETPLDFHSESYTLTRMQPLFNPGPLDSGPVPILMGAVGAAMTRVVGEVADALQTHPTNSEARFLRDVTRPLLEEGVARAGRDVRIDVLAGPMIATGRSAEDVARERAAAKQTLVFTLSTPAYWPSLEYHGWRDVGERLRDLTREGKWQEMDALVDDEIVDAFVPSGTYDEIADVILEGYGDVAERITLRLPADPAADDAHRRAIERLQAD